MSKLNLKNIILISASSDKIKETIKAIEICKSFADFKDVILFSDKDTEYTKKIKPFNSVYDYNEFIYYDLPDYVDADFILTIHWDGFIVNPKAWTESFLEYDYIGAPWPWNGFCGNSGFCLRSRKFLQTQSILSKKYKLQEDEKYTHHALHDDVMTCLKLRPNFIDMGCKYAPIELGYNFSVEYGYYEDYNSFGFHDFRLHPQFRNLIYDNDTL
jgi:hypothetical protein